MLVFSFELSTYHRAYNLLLQQFRCFNHTPFHAYKLSDLNICFHEARSLCAQDLMSLLTNISPQYPISHLRSTEPIQNTMESDTPTIDNGGMAVVTKSAFADNSVELHRSGEHDLGDLSLCMSGGPISGTISMPRLDTSPMGWTMESPTPEDFSEFPKLPLELRTMIWVRHHDDHNEITIKFKKTVYRAKDGDGPIQNVNTRGAAIKRM